MFYFDSSFRPIPLEQHFLGVRGKPGSVAARRNLDRVTFEKVSDLVAQGHQVMVFVHARKETVKAAMELKEASVAGGNIDDFSCQEHPQWELFRREISVSRNKEMRQLFDHGFGIHHAGMLRSDRNMMEKLFEARAIKVRDFFGEPYEHSHKYTRSYVALLLWHGVSIYLRTLVSLFRRDRKLSVLLNYMYKTALVIIKGTQVYDSSKGSFVDLSVLDVLQVFGRAGRPGLETSGEGYICTSYDKLTHYLESITSQA
jgi:antiviral helicase SLH1